MTSWGTVTVKTRYTAESGVRVAYQVRGHGDLDIVLVPGMASHVDLHWCEPGYARFMRELMAHGRLIAFDKRGTGRSDRVAGIPTLEDRMRDLVAVLDAAGSERALIVGVSEGAALASLFAATYPARARGLVLCSSFPTGTVDGTYLGAVRPELMDHAMDIWNNWGTGRSYEIYAPCLVGNAIERHLLAVFERAAASRETMQSLVAALFELDVRHVLPLVQVPTIMFHRRAEVAPIESARQMASLMANCQLVELEGDDHVPFSGPGAAVIRDEITRFVLDLRANRFNRAVGTVVFTDIVDSTATAATLGDHRWLQLLDAHNEVVRGHIAEYGGRVLKSTGDGFLAHFSGPVRAIRCAAALTMAISSLGLAIRAGVHTGELELSDGDVRGLAVHIGARVAAAAGRGEVLVSEAARDLAAGSGISFTPTRPTTLKGLTGDWTLFSVDKGTALEPDPGARAHARHDRLRVSDRAEVWVGSRFPWSVRAVVRASRFVRGVGPSQSPAAAGSASHTTRSARM